MSSLSTSSFVSWRLCCSLSRGTLFCILHSAFCILLAAAPAPNSQRLSSPDQVPQGLAKSDWAAIRAAYEAGRHAFQPVPGQDGVWQARNPGQQWVTRLDGRGFLAQPKAGGWHWGLELKGYGFAGAQRDLSGLARVKAEGQRLAYAWDAKLEEWFLNDQRGLEHGFTLRERPPQIANGKAQMAKRKAQSANALSFTLAVRGSLIPRVTADGKGLEFLDLSGATVLTYSGLKVTDASGKALTSRFVLDGRARSPLRAEKAEQEATSALRRAGDSAPFL